MTIFGDGISAGAITGTDDAETIIHEVIEFLKTLGFRDPTRLRKVYNSYIALEFSENGDRIISRFAEMAELIGQAYGLDEPFHLNSIVFTPDYDELKQVVAAGKPRFSIERRLQTPFSSNRFYSIAHVPTAEHVKILAGIDGLLR
jgi:hypothetical protein